MKFAYIRDHREVFDVGAMCAVFGVTAAGFYSWIKRPESARAVRNRALAEQVRAVHHEVNGIYGSLKITSELRHRKTIVNRKTVAKLMKRLGIRSKVSRKFRVRTTDSDHANPIAPNVLDQNFESAAAPNQVWGADITYIATDEGFLYLAGVMDLYSRRIVGWRSPRRHDGSRRARVQRGASFPKACLGSSSSLRPRRAVHQRPLPRTPGVERRGGEHEPHRQLLRQRRGGVVLGQTEDRDGVP